MTPKRIIFRTIVRSLEALTQMLPPERTCHFNKDKLQRKQVDIITVAFNNAELIRIQHQFLRKFMIDPYEQIVVDNSTRKEVRDEIYAFCKENGLIYLGLPKNRLNRVGGSYSHAMSLNYVYQHLIRHRQPFAFGQIDHDLFPVEHMSIFSKLENQPIYGPLRHREKWWYLSAIISFFKFDFVADKKVDFMPVTPETVYLDSGGGNWYSLYSKLNIDDIVFPDECIVPLREGGDRHGDSLEYFDNKTWLHTINGSCWKQVADGKDDLIRNLLQSILNA